MSKKRAHKTAEGFGAGNDSADPSAEDSSGEAQPLEDRDTPTTEKGSEATVEEQLEDAKREAAENYDRYLRAQAELQNVLRRHDRDRADHAKYAAEELARDLLHIVDDLERALEHADSASDGLVEGVRLVLGGLVAALEKHGVERIPAKGKPFDPTEHEAVAMVESTDHEPNTVVDEHRSGYKLRDRLLRPAMVAVSKPAAESDPGEGET